VKKIILLLTPLVILAAVYGCSKDHDAPTYSTYNQLKGPSEVAAAYNPAEDVVDISWSMTDMSGVVDFVLSVSDSSIFDEGDVRMFSTNVPNLTGPFSTTYDVSVYVGQDVENVVRYFTVSAVFKNETFNYFTGPRSDIVSAVIRPTTTE